MVMVPRITTVIFIIHEPDASEILPLPTGLMKSSKIIPARVFNAAEVALKCSKIISIDKHLILSC